MSALTLDINCDCGESFGNWSLGNDSAVMPLVTSANIACGFHASDPVTMLRTVDLALTNGVRIGAHPGLPDLLGFGRRMMNITAEDCYAYVVYQVGALAAAVRTRRSRLYHVKPHGCLMAMVGSDRALADAFVAAVADTCDEPTVYFTAPLSGAELPLAAARRGVRVVAEVYPDLAYDDKGKVVIQRHKAAALPDDCAKQIRRFIEHGHVETLSGRTLALDAQSICVHGDGPNALDILRAIRVQIVNSGAAVVTRAA